MSEEVTITKSTQGTTNTSDEYVSGRVALKLKIIMVLSTLALAITVFVAYVLFIRVTPQDVATEYIDNYIRGDGGAAYDQLSPGTQANISRTDYVTSFSRNTPFEGAEPRLFGDVVETQTDDGLLVDIIYELDSTDGQTFEFGFQLLKENNNWLIVNVTSAPLSGTPAQLEERRNSSLHEN